jgi:two-component system, cell cycle sensor histidine kinase and response regulator CckA
MNAGGAMSTELLLKDRARADQAARESDQRYRRLLGAVTDYVYSVVVEGGQAVATLHGPGCEAVTGYTAEEFAAEPMLWLRMVCREDQERVLTQVQRIFEGNTPPALEHRIQHKKGSIRWIRNTAVPRRGMEGQLAGYDGVVSDITERKRAEHLLSVQYAVSRELGQASSLHDALTRILKILCETLGCFPWDMAVFWGLNPRASVLTCHEVWSSPSNALQALEKSVGRCKLGRGKGLPGRVWAQGEPAWIPDLAQDPETVTEPDGAEFGVHGALAFPIHWEKSFQGVIEMFSARVQRPDCHVLQVLAGVGSQIGQFIERRQIEEQRQLSEERLQAILDHSPAVIHLKDLQGRYLLVNRRFGDLFHVERGEVVGKTLYDIVCQDTAHVLRNHDQQVIAARAPLKFEENLPHEDGWHTYISVKFPLLDTQGAAYATCGISTDITERMQAQRALEESQARLALVIRGSNDGIWDWNLLTNEVYFSPRWKSMLGYAEQELGDQFQVWVDLLHPEDRDPAIQQVQAYLSGQTPVYEVEHRLRHKDGSYRWILARGVALRDAKGTPVRMAGSHVDLTERKQVEEQASRACAELAKSEEKLKRTVQELKASHEQLQTTQLQLIQAAKMESVGTLAAGVAHEVKNPLQTMVMGLDYLRRKLPDGDPDLETVLDDMRDAVGRANAIVRELLQFSAASDFLPQPEDLNEVLSRSLWLIHAEVVASQTTVDLNLAEQLPPVRIDRGKIEQVFINLLLNALQAMSQGGVLAITTRAARFGEDFKCAAPAACDLAPGEVLVITEVQDTGAGISEADLLKIFDPFFTTKPVGGGTGLGLSVVKKIVELHRGLIDIKNAPGGGVRVTLALRAQPENLYGQA